MSHNIITISRQYGSGGHNIGVKLSEYLKIPLYDKQLFTEASKRSKLSESFFANAETNGTDKFTHAFDSILIGSSMPLNDRIFVEQAKTIRQLAMEQPCIIIGLGANQILKGISGVINVFIYADINIRTRRIIEEYGVEAARADKLIKSVDKNRAHYLKSYTNQIWGKAENYQLCIDSGYFGIDGTVELILKSINQT